MPAARLLCALLAALAVGGAPAQDGRAVPPAERDGGVSEKGGGEKGGGEDRRGRTAPGHPKAAGEPG